jgi:carbon monoxide dehydrogenase subunit G
MVAGIIVEGNPQMTVRSAAALEVASSAAVAGTPDAVWQRIGDFCAIQAWHPAVSKCEQTEEGGATHRTLTTTDGGTIKEKLIEQTDTSYTYEIVESPLPVENYRATISVSVEGDRTRVDWRGSFDAKGQSDADAKAVISGIYKAGLEQIAKLSGT